MSRVCRDHPRCRSAAWICMCGRTRDVVIYSRFHRNPFRGFWATGSRNLPLPIDFAIGFNNCLHYCASRGKWGDCISCHIIVTLMCLVIKIHININPKTSKLALGIPQQQLPNVLLWKSKKNAATLETLADSTENTVDVYVTAKNINSWNDMQNDMTKTEKQAACPSWVSTVDYGHVWLSAIR